MTKISELILALQKFKEINGDLRVITSGEFFMDPDNPPTLRILNREDLCEAPPGLQEGESVCIL